MPNPLGWLSTGIRPALGWCAAGSRARWLLTGLLLCATLPWFFSCPPLPGQDPGRKFWEPYWSGVVQRKIDDPWHDYTREYAPDTNESKRNFRLLVPLIAGLTHTGMTGVHVVRFTLQAVLLLCLLLAAERATGDRLAALGVALAVAGTYVGTEVGRDACYWFDNCAHAFMALALVLASPWLAWGAVMLGAFVDERVLVAVPLLALFHVVTGSRKATVVAIGATLPAYAIIRVALSWGLGLHNPLGAITLTTMASNLPMVPAATWFSLEGGWLLLLAATYRQSAPWPQLAWLWLATAAPILAATFVQDFTRSATYAFPAILVAAACLHRADPARPGRLRWLAAVAAAGALLLPNGFILGPHVMLEPSLPARLLQSP